MFCQSFNSDLSFSSKHNTHLLDIHADLITAVVSFFFGYLPIAVLYFWILFSPGLAIEMTSMIQISLLTCILVTPLQKERQKENPKKKERTKEKKRKRIHTHFSY